MSAATPPPTTPSTVHTATRLTRAFFTSMGSLSVHQGDRAHRRAVGARHPKRQGDDPAACRADLVEVGQVLDHRDALREEDVVRGALLARDLGAWREDRGADAVVGRVVVAHRLYPARHQPLAGAAPGVGRVLPEALALHRAAQGPVRAQEHDVAALHVAGAPL